MTSFSECKCTFLTKVGLAASWIIDENSDRKRSCPISSLRKVQLRLSGLVGRLWLIWMMLRRVKSKNLSFYRRNFHCRYIHVQVKLKAKKKKRIIFHSFYLLLSAFLHLTLIWQLFHLSPKNRMPLKGTHRPLFLTRLNFALILLCKYSTENKCQKEYLHSTFK